MPTSSTLFQLVRAAPPDFVSLRWLLDNLEEKSFGFVMLVLGTIGLVPGVASFSGFFLAIPAVQMIMGRNNPALPEFLAVRKVSTSQFERGITRTIPILKAIERLSRTQFHVSFKSVKTLIGMLDLILAITIILPIPFAYIVPTIAIILLSFASLEEDGVLISIAVAGAGASFLFTCASVWTLSKTVGLLSRF